MPFVPGNIRNQINQSFSVNDLLITYTIQPIIFQFFALYKKTEDFYPRPDATLATNSTIQTITGRMKKTRVAPVSSLDLPP